jgi:fibronectin type 3 domain-containing protein
VRRSKVSKRRPAPVRAIRGTSGAARPRTARPRTARQALRRLNAVLVAILGLSFLQFAPGMVSPASAASPLNVFVGYFDTHEFPFTANQPNPWPYKDPSSFDGTPCPKYPNDTTCWDAGAIRLDNPGATDVTGVQAVVTVGSETYGLWGSSQTVKAHGTLVLTETGSSQNSENFDLSDEPPNAYNGGLTASCANSGAIPNVKITIGGTTTSYLDTGQVLNTGGVDGGHCLNGKFVSGRMDESRPWVQIGAASPVAPSAPQSLAATAASGSVSLTWSPPASNGGAAVTGYNIYRGTSAGGESATPIAANVAGTGFTDTGLVNGTTYYYTVAAVNSAGVSPKSNETSATPASVQATVPSAPQSLTAKGADGSVSLSWAAPSSNGGSPVTGYDVYRGTSPGGESATPIAANVSATGFTDTSAVNGTTYYYTVAAVNAAGVSPHSAEASATPQATVPAAPSRLVASGGNGSVVLSWAVPATDGGSPITGYDVYRGTSPGGESATPLASNVVTNGFTDTSAVNGTTYYYTVVAVNAAGLSPQSGEASATPQATAPSAPLAVVASGGNSSVTVSWSVPASNGGSPISGYDVYRGTSAGGESATPVATNVAGTSFTDTGLVNGTTYYYTVVAVNAAGLSPQSGEASAKPQVPSAAAFVQRVGSVTASTSRATTTVPVGAPGVAAGHTLVVSLLLSSTTNRTGAVSATDSAGNSYIVARDTNDGSGGDRTMVLVSIGVKALPAGGSITLTYPSSAETHASVDEFSGITGIDTSAGAAGTAAAFSSGLAPATTQASDVLIGTIGIESGKAPAWASGWKALPVLSVSSDYLGAAYQIATATGAYAASGTTSGQWMASIVTLKTR